MDEAILIIENDPADFLKMKNDLSNFICIPPEHSDYPNDMFRSYNEIKKFTSDMINTYHDQIKTIIVDISLLSDTDEKGIDLIDFIRQNDSFSFNNADEWKTLIPIICFTNHGPDDSIRKKAYDKGATNYFSKINLEGTGELLLMKQNIIFQKHLFNKSLKYNFNDLQTATEILLLTSKSINELINELSSSNVESLIETFNSLIISLEEKSQIFSTKIDGVLVLIKKESEKAIKINKLLVVMNLIMLEKSKREIFCRFFATELLQIMTVKGFRFMDEATENEKKDNIVSQLLKSPTTQGLSFFSNIITIAGALMTGISEDDILQLISNSYDGFLLP